MVVDHTSAETTSSSELWRGRALVVAAAVLWSFGGVGAKSPPLQSLPVEQRGLMLACQRALFAGLFLFCFVDWRSVWNDRRTALGWRLLPVVISFAVMNLLYISALVRTSAAVAVLLQYTATGWAFLFGVLFLKEPLTRPNLLALGFAIAGMLWIIVDHWSGGDILGPVLALGSGAMYGVVIVSLRMWRGRHAAWTTAVSNCIGGLAVAPWALAFAPIPSASQAGVLVSMGVFQLGLPYMLFARGVKTCPAQEAGLISLLEAVLAPLWVALLWPEPVRSSTWFGGALIVGGLLLRYALFPQSNGESEPAQPLSDA